MYRWGGTLKGEGQMRGDNSRGLGPPGDRVYDVYPGKLGKTTIRLSETDRRNIQTIQRGLGGNLTQSDILRMTVDYVRPSTALPVGSLSAFGTGVGTVNTSFRTGPRQHERLQQDLGDFVWPAVKYQLQRFADAVERGELVVEDRRFIVRAIGNS